MFTVLLTNSAYIFTSFAPQYFTLSGLHFTSALYATSAADSSSA